VLLRVLLCEVLYSWQRLIVTLPSTACFCTNPELRAASFLPIP